jgi:hypothetical protein
LYKLLKQIGKISAAIVLTACSTLSSAQLGSLSTDLVYTPVTPCRIIDTRNAGGVLAAASTRGFLGWSSSYASQGGAASNCNIPQNTDTAAIVVNITIVSPSTGGYITAYPSNVTKPLAASLTFDIAEVKGNNAVLKLNQTGAGNHLNIYTTSMTHLVADVVGYYARPVALGALSSDLVYTPVSPCRIIDTRNAGADAGILNAGSTRSFLGWNGSYTVQGGENNDCNLPFSTNNAALVVNITAVNTSSAGFITAYPADAVRPLAATLTYGASEVRGNNAFLKLSQTSTDADFKIYTTSATHLVVDVMGYYAKPVTLGAMASDLVYTPVTPCRIIDTRNSGVDSGILNAGSQRGFYGWRASYANQGGSGNACNLPLSTDNAAIAVNFTVVSPATAGFITAYPSDVTTIPLAASLTFYANEAKASNAILKLNQSGTGFHFGVYSTSTAHLVADVVGYYAKPKP